MPVRAGAAAGTSRFRGRPRHDRCRAGVVPDRPSAAADPRVTVELNQFNLELNASPTPLRGRPFSALGGELNLLLDHVATVARHHGGWPALIGILPTLTR